MFAVVDVTFFASPVAKERGLEVREFGTTRAGRLEQALTLPLSLSGRGDPYACITFYPSNHRN